MPSRTFLHDFVTSQMVEVFAMKAPKLLHFSDTASNYYCIKTKLHKTFAPIMSR